MDILKDAVNVVIKPVDADSLGTIGFAECLTLMPGSIL